MRRALNIIFGVIFFALLAGIATFFLKPSLDGIGARLDLNGDNFLTADELPPVVRRNLEAIDSSGDGRIGPVELRFYMMTQLRRGNPTFEPPEYTGDYTFRTLRKYFGDSVAAGEMAGAMIMIGQGRDIVFSLGIGDINARTQLPLASATKWVTAGVMGALHERGDIDLNRPVGEWADIPDTHAGMTIPQMMAHVSGMEAGAGIISAPTLEDAAQAILAQPVLAPPLEQFRYGASSMMLAARIAEQQTGRPWRELANDLLFEPLGMMDTQYANPVRPLEYGLDNAPEVASGIHSTAEDYMKFLSMLANNGQVPGGRQILSPSTMGTMELAQSLGSERAFVPPAVTHEFEYAMGAWCERWRWDGQCSLLHSQGAFGTRPFLDRSTGVYGIILILESGNEQKLIIQKLREVALETAINELKL